MKGLNTALAAIDQQIGQIKSITFQYTNTPRGSKQAPPSVGSGILIYKDGRVSVGSVSNPLTITIEGGSADWEGAKKQDGTYSGPTNAQWNIIINIEKYLKAHIKDIDMGSA